MADGGTEPDLPTDARSLCEYLVRGLVDHPDQVEVVGGDGDGDEGRVLRVRVAPEDRGKVIGRGGRIVRALRSVVRAAGIRAGGPVHVEIEE